MKKILTLLFSLLLSNNLHASSSKLKEILDFTSKNKYCPPEVQRLSLEDITACRTNISSAKTDKIQTALCVLVAREQFGLEILDETTKTLIYDRAVSHQAEHFDHFIFAVSLYNQQNHQDALIYFRKAAEDHEPSKNWAASLWVNATPHVSPLYKVVANMQGSRLTQNHLSSAMGATQILTCLGIISQEPLPEIIKKYLNQRVLDVTAEQLHKISDAIKSRENERFSFLNNLYAVLDQGLFAGEETQARFTPSGAQVIPANLNDGAATSELINSIAKKDTQGNMVYVVSPDEVQGSLILVHLLHFKGGWENITPTKSHMIFHSKINDQWQTTQVDAFQINDKSLRFMKMENNVNFVALPMDGDCSLIIRHARQGVKAMTHTDIASVLGQSPEKISDFLAPCVFMKLKNDLLKILQEDITTQLKTGFRTSLSTQPMKIVSFFQKIKLELSEKGVETSAATISRGVLQCMRTPVDIIVDSPFSFSLVHNETLCPIIQGAIINTQFMKEYISPIETVASSSHMASSASNSLKLG